MSGRQRFISLRNQLLCILLLVLGLAWLALDALARYEVTQSNVRRMEQAADTLAQEWDQRLTQQAEHNRQVLHAWLAARPKWATDEGWQRLDPVSSSLFIHHGPPAGLPAALAPQDGSLRLPAQALTAQSDWQLYCAVECLLLQQLVLPGPQSKEDVWLVAQPITRLLQQFNQSRGIRLAPLDAQGQPMADGQTQPDRLPSYPQGDGMGAQQSLLEAPPVYLSVQPETQQRPALLLTLPMTKLLQEQAQSLRHFRLWLAVGLLLALGFIYLLAGYPLRRLRQLANQLPDLPDTGYPGLKARLGLPSGLVEDEVDRLHQAALSLAGRLEALDSAVNAQHAELKAHQLYDPLTGLLNRGCFLFEFNRQLTALRRQPDRVALVLIDLDNFKDINDSLGHEAGDELLKTLARRLQQQVRETDLLARLTSDEFALLLCHLKQVDDIHGILDKLLANLHEPLMLGHHSVQIGASAGVAFAQDGEHTASELLRRADLAMHEAKRQGRQGYELFSAGLLEQSSRRFFIETQLDTALQDGQLYLNYQPWVQLPNGRVMGLEALARWRHPLEGCNSALGIYSDTGSLQPDSPPRPLGTGAGLQPIAAAGSRRPKRPADGHQSQPTPAVRSAAPSAIGQVEPDLSHHPWAHRAGADRRGHHHGLPPSLRADAPSARRRLSVGH